MMFLTYSTIHSFAVDLLDTAMANTASVSVSSLVQTGGIQKIMVLAARCDFWSLNQQVINGLAEIEKVEFQEPVGNLGLFDLCWYSAKHILQCSDEEALKCCQHRLDHMAKKHAGGSAHDVFMGLGEGLQILCKDDAHDVTKEQKKCRNNQVNQDACSTECAKKMAKVKPLPKPKVDNGKGNG